MMQDPVTLSVAAAVKLLLEGAGSFGCLMLPIPTKDSVKIQAWIESKLQPEQYNSIERESHVTVLYGFPADVTGEKVSEFLSRWSSENNIHEIIIKLGQIQLFRNDGHDVVSIGLEESVGLTQLHDDLVKEFGVEETRQYNPHLTLAYAKPGQADSIEGHCHFQGETYSSGRLIFSEPDSVTKSELSIA